jgi:type IV pilus assembly protein PilQ
VPLIGQAGIVLDIVPKIGEDGYVTLRIRPSISSVYDTQQTGTSIVQLLRRRDLLAQAVRVKDGETLMLGGLVDNRDTQLVSKLPGLGDLPIVGAMLRSQTTNRNRSELVMLVTPHILNTAEPTPIHVVDTPTEAVKQFIQQGM